MPPLKSPALLQLHSVHFACHLYNSKPPTMASIHNTVSAIRSQIFNTIHNPTNARTGAKYLRKPLRGSAIVKYYPKLPKLATLNSSLPNNKYANWGLASGSSSRSSPKAIESSESPEGAEVEASTEKEEVGGRSVARQLMTSEEITGLDYSEAERREGAGWLLDEKERVRLMETTLRHAIGKGPPKKGMSTSLLRGCTPLLRCGRRSFRNQADDNRSRPKVTDEEEVGWRKRLRGSRRGTLFGSLYPWTVYHVSDDHCQTACQIAATWVRPVSASHSGHRESALEKTL
jgi:hypothetical protein